MPLGFNLSLFHQQTNQILFFQQTDQYNTIEICIAVFHLGYQMKPLQDFG